MATGKSAGERVLQGTTETESFAHEPFPLPPEGCRPEFTYPGKVSRKDLLSSPSADIAVTTSFGGTNPANHLFFGDNLAVLRSLIPTHKGRIRLIYLDPPYNTGLEFHSRSNKHAYNDQRTIVAYVEWIRRRLILCHELLADDGSLYLHIGHHMLFHVKIILDEVFGSEAFRNVIIRKKCSSKNYTRLQYPNLNDYLLFYSKTESPVWNRPTLTPDPEWIRREYPKRDGKGQYKLVPVHAPGPRNGETGKPWKGMSPPPGKHWQLPPAKLDELDKAGEIHWSRNGNPRRKVYLTEDKSIPITDYWDRYRDAHHQSVEITGYPTEKNQEMMAMIVRASSNPGDIVLDPFCGSGSTLQAAGEADRKWIGIDCAPEAIKCTVTRLVEGLKPMGDFVKKPDTLFDISDFPTRPKCEHTFRVSVARDAAQAWQRIRPELPSAILSAREPLVG
jgi:adenine-specific DNA-methyltransferase